MGFSKKTLLTIIMFISVILWGAIQVGWFQGLEIYLLPLLIVMWMFFLVQWTRKR